MFDWGNCTFVAQIFIAESIFVYSFPKRKKFVLRFFIGLPLVTLLCYFFPLPEGIALNQFYQFFRFITLFLITVAVMGFCFKVKPIVLISSCASGYALQHLSYNIMRLVSLTPLLSGVGSGFFTRTRILEIIVFPVIYLIIFFTFGRMAAKNEYYNNYDKNFIFCSIFTLFICLILSRFARLNASDNITVITNSLYAISCCLLSLFLNYSLHAISIEKSQKETLERIDYERQKQYEISKKNNELLHVQVHDLKHILSFIDSNDKNEINKLNKTIERYDNQFQTGNEALDIILNEKAEACSGRGIAFTFFGNGKLLSFVSKLDVYILFGNIIDNAIEAVEKNSDKNKRVISVTVGAQGNYVVVNSINYYTDDVQFVNGMPKTTKTIDVASHGYGTRSIKMIAEKYNGSAAFSVKEQVFDCSVFLLDGTSKADS